MTDGPLAGTNRRTLTIDGMSIAAWERPGGAPAFVFLHGNGASMEAFRPLFEAPVLAGHRLIAFDLPGSGESADAADPDRTYTLPALGDLIVRTIAAFAPEPYILVGWSLGGHLAIESLLHGARPLGVVLSGTPPCGPDPAEIAESFLPIEAAAFMQSEAPSDELFETYLKAVYGPAVPSPALRAAARRADGRMRTRLFAHIFATPDLEPQRVTVANWPQPIALIQGRQEPFFQPEKLDSLRWGKLWRGATQWVAGAGHAPFLSHTDDYARILSEFAVDVGNG